MADVETSDTEPENMVPATPVAKGKKIAQGKAKTSKTKKSIPPDEGTVQFFLVKSPLVV